MLDLQSNRIRWKVQVPSYEEQLLYHKSTTENPKYKGRKAKAHLQKLREKCVSPYYCCNPDDECSFMEADPFRVFLSVLEVKLQGRAAFILD